MQNHWHEPQPLAEAQRAGLYQMEDSQRPLPPEAMVHQQIAQQQQRIAPRFHGHGMGSLATTGSGIMGGIMGVALGSIVGYVLGGVMERRKQVAKLERKVYGNPVCDGCHEDPCACDEMLDDAYANLDGFDDDEED